MELKKHNEDFSKMDWDILATNGKLISNNSLKAKYGDKIYCHDAYAEDLAKLYGGMSDTLNKEPQIGEVHKIIDVRIGTNRELLATLTGFIDATINLEQEKKFLQILGMSEADLISNLQTEEGKHQFISNAYHVTVEMIKPYTKVSLYEGYLNNIKDEFFTQIGSPTSAYYGTVTGKNQGGFIISVKGVNGFLPGSLAAANVVRDFDSMIGKTVPVMVEDYLVESSTFVFSYKKYLNHVLPSKIEDLNVEQKYTGSITGLAKYGIFVEFDEIFTGLLHSSKMSNDLKEKFKNYEFKPGDVLDFWIREITPDKKIILSDEDPSFRKKELDEFRDQNLGIIRGGEVVSIQPFGALVKLQKDIVGLIAQKEIKMKKKLFNVGDTVMVTVERVHNDKIFLTLPNES
jgi:predicted RNA-binding protein with RPS1 domain